MGIRASGKTLIRHQLFSGVRGRHAFCWQSGRLAFAGPERRVGESMENQQQQKQQTGATNLEYDLFSEMHSLLKGNAALEQYIQDAQSAGDKEVETCFQTLHQENKQHVEELRKLIEKRISSSKA
jgi:rubrerythrin